MIGPTFLGSMYSWSLTNVKEVSENVNPLGFPFNQYFSFFMLSITAFLIAIPACRIPRSCDNKLILNVEIDGEKLKRNIEEDDCIDKNNLFLAVSVKETKPQILVTKVQVTESYFNPVVKDNIHAEL